MYGFQIRVTGETLQVWEKFGTELSGMNGIKFAHTHKASLLKKELIREVMQAKWRLEFIDNRVLLAQRITLGDPIG